MRSALSRYASGVRLRRFARRAERGRARRSSRPHTASFDGPLARRVVRQPRAAGTSSRRRLCAARTGTADTESATEAVTMLNPLAAPSTTAGDMAGATRFRRRRANVVIGGDRRVATTVSVRRLPARPGRGGVLSPMTVPAGRAWRSRRRLRDSASLRVLASPGRARQHQRRWSRRPRPHAPARPVRILTAACQRARHLHQQPAPGGTIRRRHST